jgi:hypothetical protein
MSRLSNLAVGILAVTAAPFAAAQAQETADPYNPSRFTVEPYLSQSWTKNDVTDEYDGAGGFGVRVMFGHADASQIASSFFNRARTGAFVTYANNIGDLEASQAHYGVQIDFPLLVAPATATGPLAFDPFVSLGAGIFHTSVDNPLDNGTNITSNDFALTPAIGIIVPITGEIKFRGDLRDAVLFGDNTTNNFLAEGGISIGF